MIRSIAKSKNASEKHKMNFKNLKFFLLNSKSRLTRVRSGCRLANVIEVQAKENSAGLKLIEEYLDMERKAIKLMYQGKKKVNIQEEAESEAIPFDTKEYYRNTNFDPRIEISKEKSLPEFFMAKFQQLGEEMKEQGLREFLTANESFLPSQILERWGPSKISGDESMHQIKDPILHQIEMLESEVQNEIKIEQKKEDRELTKKEETVNNVAEKSGLFNSSQEATLDKKTRSKAEGAFSNKEFRGSTAKPKEIINEILDHGRLEFLKTQRIPEKEYRAERGARNVTASVVYGRFQPLPEKINTEQGQAKDQSQISAVEHSIKFAKMNLEMSQLPAIQPRRQNIKQSDLQSRRQEIRSEFSSCKEFRRQKSSSVISTRVEVKKFPKEREKEIGPGGMVASHLGKHSLRYQFAIQSERNRSEGQLKNYNGGNAKKGSLKKLLLDTRKSGRFLENVETGVFNMKQIWQVPQERASIYIHVDQLFESS